MRFFATLLGLCVATGPVAAQVAPVVTESGVSAHPFDINQVSLTSSRFMANQNRTLSYLKFVDTNRLLYNFRLNHKLSTSGAIANGGWDAPDFPFRTHMQGHFLTAWAQCYAQLGDTVCRDRATSFVAELIKCQNNNKAAGFATGYLSGFPESEFAKLENGTLSNGNVPYYAIHKTLAGLLDVYRWIGDTNAKTVLLAFAGWVDTRTSKLSYDQMQKVMQTEFGGMNEVLADIYHQTGDKKWLTAAQRFDHAAIFDPLASNQDTLDGLHANTQVPKWIGAAREFKATGTSKYRDIAKNAWAFTVNAHSYAIGGNSQAEHFHAPNAISTWLTNDTAEGCNTYNMLKLTRELFTMNPTDATYFDFYERALINHMLGQQNPATDHGHITYFTSLNPGGHRGLGPAWGGGTWSTDYDSHWCCQGTGIETNTKMQDSIYFYDDSSLYVNLFTPSKLNWKARSVTIIQSTTFPASDTTSLTVIGGDSWAMKIRIPSWTSGATITVNGVTQSITTTPGSYATLSRTWASGDVVIVKLPMKLRVIPANDNKSVAALAFGPTVLCGDYGSTTLSANPKLDLNTVKRSGTTGLAFAGTADGKPVNIGPFYDAQGFNYAVYWAVSGSLPA
ncbi:uncharacterized protein N0V89_003959 [Didymosphaeria variabile]|uniref:DUF1680-domain-containing protein n=1 Tax=Didymosphaeria variabile TaxID=1932322 RepID=A0A9W8XPC7_9PLEO|nr:uncharacterized protein N0V89_003959 [Didymosphaeria variabile]KAJ4355934.1 hypothetical protein N0V89_003959 [Didymosphaeria variabile]